jgi:type I restriction enzyme M protein
MNLAMRGIDSSNIKWNNEGSFLNDAHPDLKADFVIANPPFNDGDWSGELLRNDGRWQYGVPPENNANYAWIQHFLYHLSPKGKLGLVLANTALSIETEAEFFIRKKIIEADLVECVIALPAKLFYSTKIEVCLWFFNRNKRQKGKTLFIDARNLGTYTSRTLKEFTDEDIKKITTAAYSFFNGKGYEDIPYFCKVATTEEIGEKNYNLSPIKYVASAIDTGEDTDFSNAIRDLADNVNAIRTEIEALNSALDASESEEHDGISTSPKFKNMLHLPNL